jgi:hypothetical protein
MRRTARRVTRRPRARTAEIDRPSVKSVSQLPSLAMSVPTVTDLVHETLASVLTHKKLVEIASLLDACRQYTQGQDGAGLSGGALSESIIVETMMLGDARVQVSHSGEADASVVRSGVKMPFSIKTLNGERGGDLALDWSRNDSVGVAGDAPEGDAAAAAAPAASPREERRRFTCPVMISVRHADQWWKGATWRGNAQDNAPVRAGIYVVDPGWCKVHVEPHLATNNKSNSIIKRKEVVTMIREAERAGRFIPYPEERCETKAFSVRRAFGLDL